MEGLGAQPEQELAELTASYVNRGLDQPQARLVAEKLMSGDALRGDARDELGTTEAFRARPVQAALASAISFCGCYCSNFSGATSTPSLGC